MKHTGFIILDFEKTALSAEDRELLKHPAVAGAILFTRNYENKKQLQALTKAIHQVRSDLLIATDQEGGRVQRFRHEFPALASMQSFGSKSKKELYQSILQMAQALRSVGINMNLAPVLDIDWGYNLVIGERSFGKEAAQVADLGQVAIDALHAANLPSVGKHFPGHGGANADSHQTLPVDTRDQQTIHQNDLLPFSKLLPSLDAIMPAHVVYSSFDPKPAGFSPFWLQTILREKLAFDGVVISDDLTMQGAAAMGDYIERAGLALDAGCDLLTVCNNRSGAIAIVDAFAKHQDAKAQARIQKLKSKYVFKA